jgi:hypothetical protein
MSKDRGKQCSILTCEKCGQPLPDPMDRIPIIMKKLRKEMGFGEKCESEQSKG